MLKKIVVAFVALCALATSIVLSKYSAAKSEMLARRESDSQIIETRVGLIEYTRSGADGPLLLHLHGSPGGFSKTPIQLPNVRTISVSRPGYLRTPLTTGRTAQEQADAYASLLDALEIDEKVFLHAVSGGGPSGYEFAARYPERTRGLIAVAAQSQSIPPEDIWSFLENDFNAWLSISMLELSEPQEQEIIEFFWSIWPYSLFRAGYENDMAVLADISLPLEDIDVPTLIIHGTKDMGVPYEQAVYASNQIGNATLISIDGADHLALFSTRREETHAAMSSFMDAH